MPAKISKLLKSAYSKTSTLLQKNAFFPYKFETQLRFSSANQTHFTFNESQILNYLSTNRFQEASQLLDEMPKRTCQTTVVLWTSLLSKYAKRGYIDQARALFELMPRRNVVSYNAMLSGYVQCGRVTEAAEFFVGMPERNVVSWTSMLCGLADAGRIDEARRLFDGMPERNVVSWNCMVVGLVRNGEVDEARRVFERMPVKSVVSWNAMIGGYAESCRMDEARSLFDKAEERNVVTWTSMISGYCRAGNVDEGYNLFRMMPERNIVSWTAMIGGFAWNGFYEDALSVFIEMSGRHDMGPNVETLVSLAYACAGAGFPRIGKQFHAQLIVNCWECDDYDGKLSKGLVHMYSEYGMMDYAHYIFMMSSNEFSIQTVNSMINGYIKVEQLDKAQGLFDTLPLRDKITWTSMINGYFSVGEVSKACNLFNNMPERDAIAWAAMISGHANNECFAEAISLFSEMRAQGIAPLNPIFSVLNAASGATANIDLGRQLHCLLIKTHLEFDLFIENSLVSMYAKCGEIEDAYCIFSNMCTRDLVSWNSMIMGFAHHGFANEALKVFDDMIETGIHPNSVTFLGVLSACSHAGLIDKGQELFHAMSDLYAVQPGSEHYVSMINLLGRAGKLEEARELVLKLPSKPSPAIWGTLLGVCKFNEKDAAIALHAASQLLQLDPLNSSGHVALCNIYAANGQHSEGQLVRKDMKLKGVKKVPGFSWLLHKGTVHKFYAGDKSDPHVDEVLPVTISASGSCAIYAQTCKQQPHLES